MVRTTNLFVILRDRPKDTVRKEPLVVLQVLDYDLRQLGSTRVHKLHEANLLAHWPDALRRLEKVLGVVYASCAQACQTVYAAYVGVPGVRTTYMNRFEVYLCGGFDRALVGSATDRRLAHGEPTESALSPELAAATAESMEDEADGVRGEWLTLGEGRPYAHTSQPAERVAHIAAQMWREVRRLVAPTPARRTRIEREPRPPLWPAGKAAPQAAGQGQGQAHHIRGGARPRWRGARAAEEAQGLQGLRRPCAGGPVGPPRLPQARLRRLAARAPRGRLLGSAAARGVAPERDLRGAAAAAAQRRAARAGGARDRPPRVHPGVPAHVAAGDARLEPRAGDG